MMLQVWLLRTHIKPNIVSTFPQGEGQLAWVWSNEQETIKQGERYGLILIIYDSTHVLRHIHKTLTYIITRTHSHTHTGFSSGRSCKKKMVVLSWNSHEFKFPCIFNSWKPMLLTHCVRSDECWVAMNLDSAPLPLGVHKFLLLLCRLYQNLPLGAFHFLLKQNARIHKHM